MGTDSYVKSIRLKFEADDVSYKKIENDMKELSKLDLFSEYDVKAIANELKEFETLKNQISSIENMLGTISDVDSEIINRTRDELEKELEKLKEQLKNKQRVKPEDIEGDEQKHKVLQEEEGDGQKRKVLQRVKPEDIEVKGQKRKVLREEGGDDQKRKESQKEGEEQKRKESQKAILSSIAEIGRAHV